MGRCLHQVHGVLYYIYSVHSIYYIYRLILLWIGTNLTAPFLMLDEWIFSSSLASCFRWPRFWLSSHFNPDPSLILFFSIFWSSIYPHLIETNFLIYLIHSKEIKFWMRIFCSYYNNTQIVIPKYVTQSTQPSNPLTFALNLNSSPFGNPVLFFLLFAVFFWLIIFD